MICPICGEPIEGPHVDPDDGETLLVLGTADGPAHMRCCTDRCWSCHRFVKPKEHDGLWAFSCCGRIWVPVVSETSLDAPVAAL